MESDGECHNGIGLERVWRHGELNTLLDDEEGIANQSMPVVSSEARRHFEVSFPDFGDVLYTYRLFVARAQQ
jgi:hypothetical protein